MNFNKIFINIFLFTALAAAQECHPVIILSSDAENVEYLLNGTPVAEGKTASLNSDTGSVVLIARQKGNLWNRIFFVDTLNITNCGTYKLNYNFSSVTYLKTEPADAYVYRNDSLLGNTPLYLDNSEGVYTLRKGGYKEKTVSNLDLSSVVNLESSAPAAGKRFYEQSLFRYLMGGLLVLGGTTAYFKLKADENYDSYRITGEGKLLDETRKYDLISGISFAALQVNFGFLLYYFLTE
jgi:hypothetical protein